jgi:hypothetical protein
MLSCWRRVGQPQDGCRVDGRLRNPDQRADPFRFKASRLDQVIDGIPRQVEKQSDFGRR